MKILLFAADVEPLSGVATSGGGMRSWQLARSLRAAGHDVRVSVPNFTYLYQRFEKNIPEEHKRESWNPHTQDSLVARHRPDAVLFSCTWIVDNLRLPTDCLRIQDLNGPQLLEMVAKGHHEGAPSIEAKVQHLAKADFLFSAGRRQRAYFLPFLMLAGFAVEGPDCLPVVPLCIPEVSPSRRPPARPRILSGGGFYPWQDPSRAMQALGKAMSRHREAELLVVGNSHGVTGSDCESYRASRQAFAHLENVRFLDFLGWQELVDLESSCSFAVELFARTTERELAVTTRSVHHLWSGLPVVYNDYSELADSIQRYDAGWVVDPDDCSSVEALVDTILADPDVAARKGAGARELTLRERDWRTAAESLLEFLKNPRPLERAPPARILQQDNLHELLASDQAWNGWRKSRAFRLASKMAGLRRRFQRPP